jgi:hypothetical protein
MTNNEKAFLKELTALTHKYGIEIVGCGCCGSPWLCSSPWMGGKPDLDERSGYVVDANSERLTWVEHSN